MKLPKQVTDGVLARFGQVIDLQAHPELLDELANHVAAVVQQGDPQGAAPFGVSWMDSWVAHWVYGENVRKAEERSEELATVLRGLVDIKFNERMGEIYHLIRERRAVPPDAGPPEPGVPEPEPSPGPAPASFMVPPDAGPPEPGVPEPPSPPGPAPFTPPDAGPPEPGVPEPKAWQSLWPSAGALSENPWILYWFLSIKAPTLLDVVDLHLTRRLQEMDTTRGP